MTDSEVITKWKQGLSKYKLATIYKRKYNERIKIIRADARNRHSGTFITNYQALAHIEKVIYKYLLKKN